MTSARAGKLSDDIAVPVERLAEAVEETVRIGGRHGLEACSWGHAGDGNIHATFMLDARDQLALRRANAAAAEVMAMALRMDGTVTGEHGIGVLKNGWLQHQWQAGAVAAHRAVKTALDPDGIFNPGKKLP